MTEENLSPDDAVLARRNLIRGGAVLAGAAGLTAVGAALAPKASAADGSAILQGADNASGASSTVSTRIRIDNRTSTAPAVTLAHANLNAPQLALAPRVVFGSTEDLPPLNPGEILNTNLGPYVGLSDGAGFNFVGILATNIDLDDKAEPAAISPRRVLDTRTSAGRTSIRRRSTSADSSGRVRAGSWIDVAVRTDNPENVVDAAYFNLTAVGGVGAGFLTAYPPGGRPSVSTVNFASAAAVCNFSFTRVLLYGAYYLVRIYATQTTHVILDVTGYALRGASAEPATTGVAAARRRAPLASRRVQRITRR